MEKKSNKYNLTLSLNQYANGTSEPARQLNLDVNNHDEIFGIIEWLQEKDPFNDKLQAAQFSLGLKLFSEVMVQNRNHPLFKELNEAFPAFMKRLKGL
ncbi:DUF3861 family protein [Mucilaginibacter sp.]